MTVSKKSGQELLRLLGKRCRFDYFELSSETQQEEGINVFENDGWTIIEAGSMTNSTFFFKAAMNLEKHKIKYPRTQ